MSILQEINILEDNKPAKFCQQNYMDMLTSSENNQSFYSIADFFLSFYNVKWAKRFISRGNIQRFVAPDRSKMISLQDSDDVAVDLFFPPLVAILFPPTLYFVVFKIMFSFLFF